MQGFFGSVHCWSPKIARAVLRGKHVSLFEPPVWQECSNIIKMNIYIYIICIGIYLSHIFSAFPFQCLPPITAISGKQQTATSGQKITEHKRHSEMTAKWQLAETAGRFQPLQRINVRSATIAPTSRPIFWNWNDPSKRSYGIQKPRSHDLTIPDRYDGRWPGYRLVDNW